MNILPDDAASRKKFPMYSGLMAYFPDALAYVSHVSYVGNNQHNPGQPLHWDRSKSNDYLDTIGRHLAQVGTFDSDKLRHSGKLAWRALANLQIELEKANTTDPNVPLRIYVGGPFTAPSAEGRAHNIAIAKSVCRRLMAKGHLIHSPHAATEFYNEAGYHFEYNRFMELDFSLLDHWATAFFYLAPSPGTDRELAVAKANGLAIYTKVEDVPACEVSPRFPLSR